MSGTVSASPGTHILTDDDFTTVTGVKVRVFRHQQRPGRDGMNYFVVFSCADIGVITNDRIMFLVEKAALDSYPVGATYTVDVSTSKVGHIQKYENFVKVS